MAAILPILKYVLGKLVTTYVVEELIIWGLKEITKRTESTADDELAKIVEKALRGK
jgi:hypothetical protein